MSRNVSEWDNVTFSDPNTIKGLLKYRSDYDLLLDSNETKYGLESHGYLARVSDDLVCLYADLDNLIEKSKFNDYQKKILNLYTRGNTEEDISEMLSVTQQSINGIINKICDTMVDVNYESWKLDYVNWNIIKVDGDFKMCSTCEEFKPASAYYFRKRTNSKDGFMYVCRNCEREFDRKRKKQ